MIPLVLWIMKPLKKMAAGLICCMMNRGFTRQDLSLIHIFRIIGKSPKRRMEGTVIPGDRTDRRNGEQKEKGTGEGAENKIKNCGFCYVDNRIRSFACIRFGWESDILCPSSVSSSPGIPRNNLPVHRTIHGWCGHRPAHIPQWSDASVPCWSDILHRSEDLSLIHI